MSEPIHIISLGAGVQSSTMSLMAACGEITPMPVAAIFADTQAEPASVYRWLDWLEKQLPFPVYRVTAGSLEGRLTSHGKGAKSGIPAFVLNPNGTDGFLFRQCTHDFKIAPIRKRQKELLKVSGASKVICWVGISVDEASRMKPSTDRWCENQWPLIDVGMKRQDCINWMIKHGFPRPPRSACVFCPYHNDIEWRRLKNDEPMEFERSVSFEIAFQASKKEQGLRGIPFLHSSRKPLSRVDFSTEEERGQLSMFNNECEGMCGV